MARIPNALESVVMRCLDRDPPRRFQDVAALARALAPFGTAEARVAADRIGRFVRARALSSPEIAAESEASAADSGDGEDSVASRRGVGQTRATFSKTGHGLRTQRGSRALPLAIGGGALFIAAAVSIGVAASRGHSKEFGPGASSTASHVAGVNSAGSTEAEKPTPAATVPATSTATATPPAAVATAPAATAAPAAKTKPSTPSTAAQSHTQTQAKPAASAPKAAPTAGFGGRD